MMRAALAAAWPALAGSLVSAALFHSPARPPRPDHPVIGAKNFTEQVVLGELLAQEIEAKSSLKVERRFYLAGSYICQQALVSGRIDAYVEYTGTALTAILKQPVDRDPAAASSPPSARLYASRYHVTAAAPLGFENTFAMVIRGDDARRLHLATLSQAAPLHAAVATRRRLRVRAASRRAAGTQPPPTASSSPDRRAPWISACSTARSRPTRST